MSPKEIPCVKTSNSRPRTAHSCAAGINLPDQRTGKVPTVVMAHGFASVKEMHLDKYAELFCTSV
jgi:hypothetical protein